MKQPFLYSAQSSRAALLLATTAVLALPGLSLRAQEEPPKPPTNAAAAGAGSSPFRSLMTPDDYLHRAEKYDAALLDPVKVVADKSPEWGMLILATDPGKPAQKAGLNVGWTIVNCDKREIWDSEQSIDPEKPQREIVAISPAGEKKTFRFPGGLLGVQYTSARRPEVTIIKDIPRGPWDKDVLLAAQAWRQGEQDLVEAAMNRATGKKMPPGPIPDFYAALLALDRGDEAAARKLTDAVLAKVAPTPASAIPRFYHQGMRTLAMGLRDMPLMRRNSMELEEHPRGLKKAQIDSWEKAGIAGMKESLLSQADAKAGENLMAKAIAPDDAFTNHYGPNDIQMLAVPTAAFAPAGSISGYNFVPPKPLHDMVWELKGAYGDTAPVLGTGVHQVYISLFDAKVRAEHAEKRDWTPEAWQVATLILSYGEGSERTLQLSTGLDGGYLLTNRAFPRMSEEECKGFVDRLVKHASIGNPDAAHIFDLKLIRIGNEVEIVVNGVTYQRAPIPPSVGDLGCDLHVTGATMHIMSCSIKEIKG